jgi:uncharacterized repeat protein (TIGR02543 family)
MKEYLQKNGKTSNDIIVAVLDSGAAPDHPHLAGRLIQGHNFSSNNPNDPDHTADGYGHGSLVAGNVVTCTPDNVKIMPLKVLSDSGSGSETSLAAAIKWAVDNNNRAKVINISLGWINTTAEPGWDWIVEEACEYAVAQGATIVAAAGNEGADGIPIDTEFVSPARLDCVITVVATDKNDEITKISLSNYGDAINVSAPGESILSSWKTGYTMLFHGTSAAASFVSAAVAMLCLDDPGLDPDGLKEAVESIATDLGDPGWDRIFGWGIIDFDNFAFHEHDWGEGVVTLPTCTENGFTTYTCVLCDEIKIENEVSALGHTAGEKTTVKEATCEETGEWEIRCTVCNELLDSGEIPATGCTVTFDADNGSDLVTISVPYDNKVNKPADPVKTEYTFQGWFIDKTLFDFNTPITGDITLKANWKPVENKNTPDGPPKTNETPNQVEESETTEPEVPLAILFTAFINGYPDNTIRGVGVMSREEFVNILYKLKNPDALPEADPLTPSFNDVAPKRWSYNAIEWAAKAGIIEADIKGNFIPAAPLTRAGMAVMLMKAEGWSELADNIFIDIDNHPHRNAILAAVKAGIFIGYTDGTFKPDSAATRYEVITAMVRYLLTGEPTDDMWVDIPVAFIDLSRIHWAYKYVALATTGYIPVPGITA